MKATADWIDRQNIQCTCLRCRIYLILSWLKRKLKGGEKFKLKSQLSLKEKVERERDEKLDYPHKKIEELESRLSQANALLRRMHKSMWTALSSTDDLDKLQEEVKDIIMEQKQLNIDYRAYLAGKEK